MNDGRNILSDDKAKALREIIEQEEAVWVYAIPARRNCKTMAAKAALERAMEQARKRAPIIAVDFDGTLCDSAWPEIGEPHVGVIAYCIAVHAAGWKLILWTNRTGKELQAAVDWCRMHHLEFDAVNENLPECIEAFGGDCRKIFADYYIDDKSLPISTVDKRGMDLLRKYAKE